MSELVFAERGHVARAVPCGVVVPPKGDVVAGLTQESPPDALDGLQVTALAGVVAPRGEYWDGVVCLTGARSAWVHVSAGEVISFASFVSGQIAAALGAQGDAGFEEAMADVMSRPERLASTLARAADAPGQAMGALIGAELAATRPYWLGQQVIVVGDARYAAALGVQGVPVETSDWASAMQAGEAAIRGAVT